MANNYPQHIDAQHLKSLAHISTAEIKADADDTAEEMVALIKQAEAERTIADTSTNPLERRLMDFKSTGHCQQVEQMKAFIAYLDRVLEARVAAGSPQ